MTWKDEMKRMEVTNVVMSYLQLFYSWQPTDRRKAVQSMDVSLGKAGRRNLGEITRGSRSHLERSWCSQTSGPGRPLASHIKPLI